MAAKVCSLDEVGGPATLERTTDLQVFEFEPYIDIDSKLPSGHGDDGCPSHMSGNRLGGNLNIGWGDSH